MKPLFADLEVEWRGGQNQALLLLRELRAMGHGAELLAATGSALAQRAAAAGIRVRQVSRSFAGAAAAPAIRSLLSGGRFDLLHVNEPHALTAAWLARAHRRVPVIVSRRVAYPLRLGRLALARYRSATRVAAISQFVLQQLAAAGLAREKLRVVYEGEDIPAEVTAELRTSARTRWNVLPDAPLLGCVSVLTPDKGQAQLIRDLPGLRAEFPGVKLLLGGDGPERNALEALAQSLSVSDAVIFAGFVRDVGSVYAALDVFLFPAQLEGLGTSLLAAMAHGVPAVAYRRGAFPEIIEGGVSGFLVDSNAEGFSAAVLRLLRDPILRTQMGEAARRRVTERFSSSRMAEETIALYEEVLSAGK